MNKGFYKNASTMSPFQFDRIYPNKYEMDTNCNGDGVFIGRYVFVEYNDENVQEYANNSGIDFTNYGKIYDSTIWQKIYNKDNNKEEYIQIASLDTPLPDVSTKIVSPGTNPKVSINHNISSSAYEFELPKAWGFKVKEAEYNGYSDEVDGSKDLNIYYNKDAFDKIRFEEKTPSDTWAPYKYYIKYVNLSDSNSDGPYEEYNGNIYCLSLESQEDSDTTYYKKIFTSKNDEVENEISLKAIDTDNDEQEDTKVLSLILPGLGNAAAEIYDLLYKDGENRNSFIYSSIEENPNMYDNNGNPLYNDNEKSVVGLMNKVYDLIGHMKVIELSEDIKLTELKSDTIIIQGTNDSENIALGNYNDLAKTLFKQDNKYYLILKIANKDSNVVTYNYKSQEFNEKSLYYLIAEMENLISGSYDGIFNALDNELQINGNDGWIQIVKDPNNNLSYEIKHVTFTDDISSISIASNLSLSNNNEITWSSYPIDQAGHIDNNNTDSIFEKIIYIPSAFTDVTIPKQNSSINESIIPIGSFWYDTSDLSQE